ncbi:MAG TPA: hypothetical protein VK167_05515 [Flavipsychrobacter sp.]|nr:hypothetical protein [Flavipsychrobacter sp.]
MSEPIYGGKILIVNNTNVGTDSGQNYLIQLSHQFAGRSPVVVLDEVVEINKASTVGTFTSQKGEDDYWTFKLIPQGTGRFRTFEGQIKANYTYEDSGAVICVNIRQGDSSGKYDVEMVFPVSDNVTDTIEAVN